MRDWLQEGHLAFFVIDAVELIDTSAFHAAHPGDRPGRPGYDPDMMLCLLLYSYATGMRSSRAIERACGSDVAFRVITANKIPDHGTIARFRAENEAAIAGVFVEVVKLCSIAGLSSLGTIAIDGTKVGSDAALDANRTTEWIETEIATILAEATRTDSSEDEGQRLFDVDLMPEPLRTRRTRLSVLRAALQHAEAAERAGARKEEARADKAEVEASAGRKTRGRKPKDPRALLARCESDLKAATVNQGLHPFSSLCKNEVLSCTQRLAKARRAVQRARAPKVTVNLTDPESKMMNTPQGWVQGYNVQAAVNEHQVVISYAATTDHNDVHQLVPMINATVVAATTAGIHGEIGLLLADAGYWSEDNATAPGPDRLIATTKDWRQRRAARELGEVTGPPPKDATTLEAMEHRLRTKQGAQDYARRSHTVEPVFGNAKENRGYRRFMRRGLAAAGSEAALIFATHNLLKIFTYNPSVIFSPS